VLLHLADQLGGAAGDSLLLAVRLEVDLERVVDLGQLVGREDRLDHDALDLLDATGAAAVLRRPVGAGLALFALLLALLVVAVAALVFLLAVLSRCFHVGLLLMSS
jgi:hypothetical protein